MAVLLSERAGPPRREPSKYGHEVCYVFPQGTAENHALLDLCRKRDVEAACDLLKRHVQCAGTMLKEAVQQRREKTA